MSGKEDSYVLYFNIVLNEKLQLLHSMIYNLLTNSYYDPDKFKFHITITIDKDLEKILCIKSCMEKSLFLLNWKLLL